MPRWAKPALFVAIAAVGAGFLWWQQAQGQSQLRLDGHRYAVSIMRTDDELERGLSGTDNLPAGQAMLFAFPRDDKWAMWMKDMKYPIDMVWLSSDKLVVYTVKNAQPSSYPTTQFSPPVNARYVIELPSGTIEQTGIKIGDPAGMPSGV
jgi:uncharacterized membrane protein (UPF0127 family)